MENPLWEPMGESLRTAVHEFLVDLHITEIRETIRRSDGLLPVWASSVISRATADRVGPHTRTIILDLVDGQIIHGIYHSYI
jgi:hypothetical protein